MNQEITNPGGNATGSGIDHVPSQKGWKFVFPTSEFQCRIPHVTRLQSTLAKIKTKLAQVFLSHIWNYNPTIFFNIPQTALENHRSTTGGDQVFSQKLPN
ncbi:hypothetical protein PSHT_02139 [Puccinia striiformis]|uniref:Uncharacterized protein n=1 Tax=Puccinia striiformis TaxID=27350 RepID=A0A2S4WII9_9BASI|nr:hypothetical protein PSHT_02139 [Puccinia striiformis]